MDDKRVFVALDVDNLEKVGYLVSELAPHAAGFKIGLELINAVGGPQAVEFVHKRGGLVFYDGKFDDIPNTVAGASRAIAKQDVEMFNVHIAAGFIAMRMARKAIDESLSSTLILGVTVLTSRGHEDYEREGLAPTLGEDAPERVRRDWLQSLVCRYAVMAQTCGLDGVIASAQEAEVIRAACGRDFLIVTPGVRPVWAGAGDQKRITTPAQAIKAGADYIVVGRPILNPPKEIGGPVEALKRINKEVAAALAAR